MDIEILIENLLVVEGEYSNQPDDNGGPTRWGVTQATARQHGYTGDMRYFPLSDAKTIYKRIYWHRPGLHRIAEHAPRLAEELFDTGVNMGPAVAARFLQRTLNVLNRNGRDYQDIMLDGKIGRKTIAALAAFINKRDSLGEKTLIKAVEALQGERYIHLAESRPANESFLFGWLANRIGQSRADN